MENMTPSNKDQLPIYNIKAVSGMLDLRPVTLRAWERRYGLPSPHRGEQGYRLYSEYDVRLLRWLKQQNDSGMSIGQAAKYLTELQNEGKDPAVIVVENEPPAHLLSQTVSLQNLSIQFYQQLKVFNEKGASEVLRRAFSLYNVDQVLSEVVEPAMVEIGEAWHQGEIPIAVEHFATNFCVQHLMSMLAASSVPTREGVIFAACAPGEFHQIGLLNLVVMLRWRGWNVKYFGQDLSLERLVEPLKLIKPDLIMFSATRKVNAIGLEKLPELMKEYPYQQPQIVVGGRAYLEDESLIQSAPGKVIIDSPTKTVEQLEKLIYQRKA